MNKLDLAVRLARQLNRSRANAADQVDALVYKILKDLKHSAEKAPSAHTERVTAPRQLKERR